MNLVRVYRIISYDWLRFIMAIIFFFVGDWFEVSLYFGFDY